MSSSSALANLPDLSLWIRDHPEPDKEGLLLIQPTSVANAATREFFFRDKSEEEKKEPLTLRAKLLANLLSLWDCDLPADRDPSDAGLLVLERVMVELVEPTPGLPYPLRLSYRGGALTLSTFSEDDRESWLSALSKASRELLDVQIESMQSASEEADVKHERRGSSIKDRQALFKGLLSSAENVAFEFPPAVPGGRPINAEEWMFESRLSFLIPEMLVKLYLSWDQQLKMDLELAFPFLSPEMENVRRRHLTEIGRSLSRFQRVLDFLDSYQGPHFKRSTARDQAEFLFIPTNLHVQRFSVLQEVEERAEETGLTNGKSEPSPGSPRKAWKHYDHLTSGTCSAVALGFEDGGCCRIRQTLLENLPEPERVDACSEMRFYPRRAILRDLHARLEALRARLRRSDEWKLARFKSLSAERLLIELREITTVARDWTAGFPLVAEAVDELARLEAAETERTPTALLPDDGELERDGGRESLDVLWTDADSLLTSLSTKVATLLSIEEKTKDGSEEERELSASQQSWLDNTRQVAERALDAVSQILSALSEAQLYRLIRTLPLPSSPNSPDLIRLHYTLQYRRDVIFSQALTIVTTGLGSPLWLCGEEESEAEAAARACDHWASLGPLLVITAYLSTYGDEKGMLEDMVEAWHQIQAKVRFQFVAAFSSFRSPTCTPLIQGSRSDILVSVPIPDKVFRHLAPGLREGGRFRVYPAFFNVGINAEVALSHFTGSDHLEREINADGNRDLGSYLESLNMIGYDRRGRIGSTDLLRAQTLKKVMEEELERGERKNTRLLRLAAQVGRTLGALNLHACKSGKDRTGMGITLEEARILRETMGLPESRFEPVLRALRTQGVRRVNCEKNIGVATYAFSSMSAQFLPPEYRPPPATYGILNKYLT